MTNPLQATVSDPTGTISATVDQLGRIVSYTDSWGQTTTTYNPGPADQCDERAGAS